MAEMIILEGEQTSEKSDVIQTAGFTPGCSLLKIMLEAGVLAEHPCNGRGTCGKCRVRVVKGKLHPVSETERNHLTEDEVKEGIRLACQVYPQEDLTVQVFRKEKNHRVLTDGYLPWFEKNPPALKCKKNVCGPDDESCTGNELRQNCGKAAYGLAVDLGTTTVAMSLISLADGKEAAKAAAVNPQKAFGLDVLTRITYESEMGEKGVTALQDAIVKELNAMTDQVCKEAGAGKDQLFDITVAANCTMLHMLLGIPAVSLGRAPYTPQFTGAQEVLAQSIGLSVPVHCRLYCLPSVSAYIGADIVGGVRACEMERQKENTLLIDIGTNGEMVLAAGGRLLSCSCAAGPALEGMDISCGMRAADGAVSEVSIREGSAELSVIGDVQPVGICGSGILSVIRELYEKGFITASGAFVKPETLKETDRRRKFLLVNGKKREFLLWEKDGKRLTVTQKDVRQVQLAKGALLSGFYLLLSAAGITAGDLDQVLVAGQFGAHLPAKSLVGSGILPPEVQKKIRYVGNTSKTGAYLALMSDGVRKEMELLAKKISYIDLGSAKGYEKIFTRCLAFGWEKKQKEEIRQE